jgi:hypothetical protein
MSELVWDRIGDRTFEAGVDKGVLWLPQLNYVGIPWNGLISVSDTTEEYTTQNLYFDGERYMGAQRLGAFSGSITAITYPDAFEEVVKTGDLFDGLQANNQAGKPFHMSYRTLLGNDTIGTDLGYRIHLLYNLVATEDDSSWETMAEATSVSTFSWNVSSVPVDLKELGFSQTAHVIIDSRYSSQEWLAHIEDILYGTVSTSSHIPDLPDLITDAISFGRMIIVDHGDGTWSAIGPDARINMISSTEFELLDMKSIELTVDSFMVSSDNIT